MLVNGSSVGLGTLLERVDSKTGTSATPKPKAKAPAAKPKVNIDTGTNSFFMWPSNMNMLLEEALRLQDCFYP